MKKILVLLLLVTSTANAEVIISAIGKQEKKVTETVTSLHDSSVVTKTAPSTNTTSSSSYSDVSSESSSINLGLLIQVVPSDSVPIALGIGIFQDKSFIGTFGIRFK